MGDEPLSGDLAAACEGLMSDVAEGLAGRTENWESHGGRTKQWTRQSFVIFQVEVP